MPRQKRAWALLCGWIAVVATAVVVARGVPQPSSMRTLTKAMLEDKIRGGWVGQMIGVAYGAPTEFRSNRRIIAHPIEWTPDQVAGALQQAHADVLAELAPDFAGFRSAVCTGDSSGALDATRLRELAAALRNAQLAFSRVSPSSNTRMRASSAR